METTVVKALKVLEVLATEKEPCALALIAERCSLTKSNAHRLLQTLIECRYVRQDVATKGYTPTMRLWEFGTHVFKRVDLCAVSAPSLATLAAEIDETVHLSMLDVSDVVHVETVVSRHTIRVHVEVGDRAPAFCTAAGRAILAFRSPETVSAACRQLKPYTAATLLDVGAIRADLAMIRARGHAQAVGEYREGVLGIAAPICSGSGVVVAAVGMVGPIDRLLGGDLDRVSAAVRRTAATISVALGLDEPSSSPLELFPAASVAENLEHAAGSAD